MIPIFVISLPEAVERRKRITQIFDELGLNFDFVDAVDGRGFDVLNHPIYNRKKRLACFGKDLTGGDLGCTLSHKKIYQHMVDNKVEQALIFEDDIIIRDGFLNALNTILSMSAPYDMIRFFGSQKLERLKFRHVYKLNDTHYLDRHNGMPGGSHATLMTLNGAQKMLKHLDYIAYPIDAILGRSWLTGCNWYTVRPGLVAQDRTMESSIGDSRFDNKKDTTGFAKNIYLITRAWFKFTETMGKKYWYYKTYLSDKKHANF